jgi:hypothetical protein
MGCLKDGGFLERRAVLASKDEICFADLVISLMRPVVTRD